MNGPCVGCGLTAVLATDFVLCNDRATLSYPEVTIGIATNEMAHRGRTLAWADAVPMGETMRRLVSASADTVEGRDAWREKQPPQWSGH